MIDWPSFWIGVAATVVVLMYVWIFAACALAAECDRRAR